MNLLYVLSSSFPSGPACAMNVNAVVHGFKMMDFFLTERYHLPEAGLPAALLD